MKKLTHILLAFMALSLTSGMPRALAEDPVGDFFGRLGSAFRGDSQIPQLAQELVEGARDEEEKAYAIYSWVAAEISYDIGARDNAEAVLRTRVAKCGGYTNLLKALLDAVGIQNRRRSARIYAPWFRDGLVGHAWNEVRVNGRWIHVDATWGHTYPGEYFDFGGHE